MRSIKLTLVSGLTIGLLLGSVEGVAAQDEGLTSPEFVALSGSTTTDWERDSCMSPEWVSGVTCGNGIVEASDERLSGVAYFLNDEYVLADPSDPEAFNVVSAATEVIHNDGGDWVRHTYEGFVGEPADGSGPPFKVYVGDGGYAGLTALLQPTGGGSDDPGQVTVEAFEGIIIAAPAPAFFEAQEVLDALPDMSEE
jgi:hypothetical protein